MSETTEKKKKQDEDRDELFKELDKYDKSTGDDGADVKNESTALKKLEYDLPTDDEIKTLATNSVSADKAREEYALKNLAKEKTESAQRSKREAEEQAFLDKVKSDGYYKDAMKRMENQALKRGVSRSSIAIGELAELENSSAAAKRAIDEEARRRVIEIDDQIATLESDLAKNLAATDDKYAKAIDLKIKELKDERDKKTAEMIKYNNTVNEKIQQGAKGEAAEEAENAKNKIALKKMSAVVTYYNSFKSPEDALKDFLSDTRYIDYLGEYYVNVYKILSNRAKNA